MGATLLSPSKTNEERVARIIKDLNWQAKFDELSDNLRKVKRKELKVVKRNNYGIVS